MDTKTRTTNAAWATALILSHSLPLSQNTPVFFFYTTLVLSSVISTSSVNLCVPAINTCPTTVSTPHFFHSYSRFMIIFASINNNNNNTEIFCSFKITFVFNPLVTTSIRPTTTFQFLYLLSYQY